MQWCEILLSTACHCRQSPILQSTVPHYRQSLKSLLQWWWTNVSKAHSRSQFGMVVHDRQNLERRPIPRQLTIISEIRGLTKFHLSFAGPGLQKSEWPRQKRRPKSCKPYQDSFVLCGFPPCRSTLGRATTCLTYTIKSSTGEMISRCFLCEVPSGQAPCGSADWAAWTRCPRHTLSPRGLCPPLRITSTEEEQRTWAHMKGLWKHFSKKKKKNWLLWYLFPGNHEHKKVKKLRNSFFLSLLFKSK